ncbi:MAG: hypothetical protein JJV96_00345, partial [Alphaproteobacteria bacterium]|nr:hypothetical protein [Alphaproteobacteria bacterium]
MNIAYKIFTIFFIAILMFSQNIDARSVGASDRTATTEGTETRASSKRTSFAPRRSATGGVPPLERPSTNSRTGLSSTAKKFDRSTVYKEGDELGLKNVGAVTGIAYSRCLKTYSGCMDSYCKDLSRSKAMSRCACSTDVLDIKDEDGNIKIEGYYTKEKRQENTLEDLSATASYLQQLENINDPALLTRLTNVDDIENTLASLEDYFGGSRADSSGFDKDGNLLEEEEEGIDGGSTDDIWAKFGLGKDLYDKALEEQCELVLFSSVCKDVNVTVVSIEYSSKVVYDCKKYIMAISGMDKTIARTETALKKLALSITQQSYRSNNKLKFQGCLAELDDCIIKKCGKEYGNCITNNQYSVFSFGSSDVTYSSPALSLKYDSTTGAGDISLEKSRHNASLVGVINYINATLEPTKRNEIAGNTGRSLLPNEYQGYPIYSNLESKAESCSNIFDLCQDADRGLYVESDLPNKYNLINDSANTPENQRYTEADYARDHTARIGTVKSNEDKENNIFEAWFLGTALPSIKKTYLLAQTT